MFDQITYVTQTYKITVTEHGTHFAIDQQMSFSTPSAAEERAQRAFAEGDCAGVDAFKLVYDPEADEVSDPVFLMRLGKVPSLAL